MTHPLPPELVDYDQELSLAIRRELTSRHARRRRIAVPLGACAATAAIAAGITVAGSVSSGGGLSPQPADAAILRHAVRALTAPAGSILHVVATDVDRSGSAPPSVDSRDIWMLPVRPGTPCDRQDCPAELLRESFSSGRGALRVDSSTNPRELTDLYDSATNTVYVPPTLAASWQAPEGIDPQNFSALDPFSTGFASDLQHAIAGGRAHVAGRTTLDSRPVIAIDGETDICDPAGELPPGLPSRPSRGGLPCERLASWTYDVTPVGEHPVQLRSTLGTSTDTITFRTWEQLPAAGHLSLFNLTTQHPGARVDRSAADYAAEGLRFDAAEKVPPQATATFVPPAGHGARRH